MRRAALCSLCLLVLAGCGNPRQSPPDVLTPGPPIGANRVAYPAIGLAFRSPGGWSKVDGSSSFAVATISTGQAVIGIWRYPRTEPLPATAAELDVATAALVAAAKARDPTFTPIRTSVLKVGGSPAVQVRATETVDGQQRMVRSTHVYAQGAEFVIDAFCPIKDFKRVDAQVFRPMLQTFRFTAPKAAG